MRLDLERRTETIAFRQQRSEAAPQIWSIGLNYVSTSWQLRSYQTSSLLQSLAFEPPLYTPSLSISWTMGLADFSWVSTFLILSWFSVTFTPLLLL